MNQKPIHPWRWRFLLLWVIVFTGLVMYALQAQKDAIQKGKESHSYLCFVKLVLLPERIQATLTYETQIELHQRKPIPGVTVADLSAGVQRDQATLKALKRVHC